MEAELQGRAENVTKVRLLTIEEVAERLQVKVSWVKEHTRDRCEKEKRVPHIKLGRFIRFNEKEIEAWIERGCVTPEDAPAGRKIAVLRRTN